MRYLTVLLALFSLSCCISPNYAADTTKLQTQEIMKSSHNLVLFYKPSCPYCQEVLTALHATNKGIQLKNIQSDQRAVQELVQIGGKRQVPCLLIDGKPLYESQAILKWLSQN